MTNIAYDITQQPDSIETNTNSIKQDTATGFNFFDAKKQSIIQVDTSIEESSDLQATKPVLPKEFATNTTKPVLPVSLPPEETYNPDTIPYMLESDYADKALRMNFMLKQKSLKPTKNTITKKNKKEVPLKVVYTKQESVFYHNYKYSSNTNWETVLILISLIIFGWVRLKYKNVISDFVKAATNSHFIYQTFKDTNILKRQASALLDILFYINVSLLLFQIFEYNNIGILELSGFKAYMLCFVFCVIVYAIKYIIHKLIGILLIIQNDMSEYVFHIYLYNKFAGIIILPFIASYPFVSYPAQKIILYIAVILLIILYIVRIFRGILISFKKRLSVFYIILYLCTLEILPVIVLYKLYTYL